MDASYIAAIKNSDTLNQITVPKFVKTALYICVGILKTYIPYFR